MKKGLIRTGLVISIIVLFIGVGIHPAFAVETKHTIINQPSVEDCGVSKNSLEVIGEVEKREVNKQNGYDCLPCAFKENILNNAYFSLSGIKPGFFICFIIFFIACYFCFIFNYHRYEQCWDDAYEGYLICLGE